MKRALALVSLLVLTAAAPFENAKLDGEAFSRPMPGLNAAQSKSFHAGSGLFRQAWVIGPSQDHPDVVGLGPLYNRLSCIACHVKNGRGAAPGDEGGVARAMVLRLSKPGVDRGAFGGPVPHPVY
ncbi:MAG TPA: di-heme oxidoredictase family protein, partial [Methylocystis sp.]